MAAATAESVVWRDHEFANVSVAAELTSKLCPFSTSACAQEALAALPAAVVESMRSALKARLQEATTDLMSTSVEEVQAAMAQREHHGSDTPPSAYHDGLPLPVALEELLSELEGEHVPAEAAATSQEAAAAMAEDGAQLDREDEAEETRTVAALETQVWLELDALSRAMDYASVPAEILGLLPPPPAAGWPLEFAQERASFRLRERAQLEAQMVASGIFAVDSEVAPIPFVPVDESYPALRRAARLSYAIWAIIASESEVGSLQPRLEAKGTSERLRMALLRMREISSTIL